MPTTFDQPVDGDVTHVSQINQYAAAVNNLEKGVPYWGGDSAGGTTAYTASVTPAAADNTAGTIVNLRMNATNTGATTLAVNGHTALAVRSKGAALSGGELQINGVYTFICDGTYWHLVGVGGSASTNASTAFSSGQIPLARGGTGADLSATGGTGQYLKQASAGGTITVGTIASGDLPSHNHAASNITSGQLAVARGGVGADLSATGGTGQVLKQKTSGGNITVEALAKTDMPFTGTPDGTKFLKDDQTWGAISVTNTALVAQLTGVTQILSAATWTSIPFGSETLDTDNGHSTSSNTDRYTVPTGKAGKYLFIYDFTWLPNSSGQIKTGFAKNGTRVSPQAWDYAHNVSGYICNSGSLAILLDLADADYVTVQQNPHDNGYLYGTDNGIDALLTFSLKVLRIGS